LYCHSKGISHRDIKLENIILCKGNKVKLIDFGLSHEGPIDSTSSVWCGSSDYVGPEILRRKSYVCSKADIWSLGIVLYTLIFAELPFDYKERVQCIKSNLPHPKVHFPKALTASEGVKHLILGLLNPEPSLRLPLDQALNHKWLRKSSPSLESMFRHALLPTKTAPPVPTRPRKNTIAVVPAGVVKPKASTNTNRWSK